MSDIDPILLNQANEVLKERYSQRFQRFGDDPKTLGWDTRNNQWLRFDIATESIDMTSLSILDVGCGLGDFHRYLNQKNVEIESYSGIDINSDLIGRCCEKDKGIDYKVGNLLTLSPEENSVDIVCMFGLLNFRFSEFDNEDYAMSMISQAFKTARKAVVVDMLSECIDDSYPKESFVYYYSPSAMLDFSLGLTPYVKMRHDYRSIPQREFMLVLRKLPCE